MSCPNISLFNAVLSCSPLPCMHPSRGAERSAEIGELLNPMVDTVPKGWVSLETAHVICTMCTM